MASSGGGAMAADPQGIFIERLGVEPRVAIRIFGQIQTMYSAQIAQAEASDLVYAVNWAADQLRLRFDAETLATIDSSRLRAALTTGCPLCASRGSSSSTPAAPGSSSGSGTPVPAG
jgi:hypothetical protein